MKTNWILFRRRCGTLYLVLGTRYLAPGTRYLVTRYPGTLYQVQSTWCFVPGTRYQVPGFPIQRRRQIQFQFKDEDRDECNSNSKKTKTKTNLILISLLPVPEQYTVANFNRYVKSRSRGFTGVRMAFRRRHSCAGPLRRNASSSKHNAHIWNHLR